MHRKTPMHHNAPIHTHPAQSKSLVLSSQHKKPVIVHLTEGTQLLGFNWSCFPLFAFVCLPVCLSVCFTISVFLSQNVADLERPYFQLFWVIIILQFVLSNVFSYFSFLFVGVFVASLLASFVTKDFLYHPHLSLYFFSVAK